jgi:hypothetical protein
MSGYNPIYKGLTDAKIDAIYDNLDAMKVFRSIAANVHTDYTDEIMDRVHDFVVCAEANDETAELTRRADPLIYERLACPQECPVLDPEKVEAEIKMREESELTDRAEWQMRQKRNEPL